MKLRVKWRIKLKIKLAENKIKNNDALRNGL